MGRGSEWKKRDLVVHNKKTRPQLVVLLPSSMDAETGEGVLLRNNLGEKKRKWGKTRETLRNLARTQAEKSTMGFQKKLKKRKKEGNLQHKQGEGVREVKLSKEPGKIFRND